MRRDLIDAQHSADRSHGSNGDSENAAKADLRAAKPSKMRSLTNSLFAAFKSKAHLRAAAMAVQEAADSTGDFLPSPET